MTNELSKEIFGKIKESKSGLSFQSIKKSIGTSSNLTDNDRADLSATIKRVLDDLIEEGLIKCAKNPNGKSSKNTFYRQVIVRATHGHAISVAPAGATTDTLFKGCAGEYAVMSELLFLGFDVNLMTVDKGQDIIAHKDGEYYFIQVKTTSLKNNLQATWDIPKVTINRFFSNNTMRYVLVARCEAAGKAQNRFFSFTNSEINTFITQKFISNSRDKITVKIKYENGIPYLYDKDKKQGVSQWENFDSIVGRMLNID